MKYLVITDIHGSYKYLEQVLNKVTDYDKILILGDILYHGPRNDLPTGYEPKKVIEKLNSLQDKIIAVRGNCDAKVDLMVLNFYVFDDYKIEINNKTFFLTHGDDYNKDYFPIKDKIDYVLHGHFHVNEINVVNDVCFISLGSLSIPKDNHHSYMIINDDRLTIYDLLTDEVLEDIKI